MSKYGWSSRERKAEVNEHKVKSVHRSAYLKTTLRNCTPYFWPDVSEDFTVVIDCHTIQKSVLVRYREISIFFCFAGAFHSSVVVHDPISRVRTA